MGAADDRDSGQVACLTSMAYKPGVIVVLTMTPFLFTLNAMYILQAYKASWAGSADPWISVSRFEDATNAVLNCLDFCDRNSCDVRLVEESTEIFWLGNGILTSQPRAGLPYQLEIYSVGHEFNWVNFGHFLHAYHATLSAQKIIQRTSTAFRIMEGNRLVARGGHKVYFGKPSEPKANWLVEGF